MANTTASVSINVPQEEIRQHILLAVGEALSKNKSALVEAIVKETLTKPEGTYSRETPLEVAVKRLITEETKHAIADWIELHRDAVRALVAAALKKNQFAEVIAEAVTAAVSSGVYATIGANVVLVRKEDSED